MADLAIILTVRSDSERLKDKCFTEIKNKPLVYWIIKRLSKIKKSQVVMATTRNKSDDRLAAIAGEMKIPVFRGETLDVVARVDRAMRQYVPECKLVFRALADMPFISVEILNRAVDVMLKYPQTEAILWHLPPEIWPVYGAREFPYSRSGWDKIARRSSDRNEREHTDMYFHRNRRLFRILYHEPPETVYFRPYRLELDYEEDARLIQSIGKKIGLLNPLDDVIRFLDKNPEIANLNRERVERTGPLTSYQYTQQRIWFALMNGKSVLKWDDEWDQPLNDKQTPVFCKRGHMLGFAQHGILYTADGQVQLEAGKVKCPIEDCGSSKYWQLARPRGG